MKISEIAAVIEEVTAYPLVSIRRDNHYILVDIGFVNEMGHASPIVPFVVHDVQLEDPVNGPEYIRVMTREACEKLSRFLPEVAVHP